MANILQKAIRLKKKEFKILTKILGLPKGSKCYILKRDGTTKPFTILGIFEHWNEGFNKFRHSKFFSFAVGKDDFIEPVHPDRPMKTIIKIATHIAVIEAGGDSQVYTIRNGDDWLPYYMDWTYTLFATAVSDPFDPAANEDPTIYLITPDGEFLIAE